MKTIGEKAKEFRESKGWNTTRMGKEVKTSRQSIENLEAAGNRQPRYIDRLAKVMGTTVDELIGVRTHASFVTASTPENQPNVAVTHTRQAHVAINLENNPAYPSIRRVSFKLSAGASGFGVDYIDEDEAPIVFQRKWFERNGYIPEKLLAVRVANGSMEPGLYDGDTVVVNTADTNAKDGEVFAMNYEGEMVIKRLMRDAGQWWLASDNPDQRRYPRKVCGDDVFCLGRVVHKQSERI